MRVYKCLVSGDEFVSDSYPAELIMNDACLEVKARFTKKGSDSIKIAADDESDDDADAPTVIDIVDSFQLNEVTLSKKDYGAWAKDYLKKIVGIMTEKGQADRVDGFKKGATELVKFTMSKIDEMQFWCG